MKTQNTQKMSYRLRKNKSTLIKKKKKVYLTASNDSNTTVHLFSITEYLIKI